MFQPIIMANIKNSTAKPNDSETDNRPPPSRPLKKSDSMKEDLVGRWEVPLCDRVYVVEFEHGTTSGKRVVTVDDEEILRRDWMFRLVGDEVFTIGEPESTHTCILRVEPRPAFTYEYQLLVDGQELSEFVKKQSKSILVWFVPHGDNKRTRLVLDKISLDIWMDGHRIEAEGEFTDRGTETKFVIGGKNACILASASGDKKKGIEYELYVDDVRINSEEYCC